MEGIHSSDQQNGDIGLQEVIDDVMEDLVDDIILGVCFEVHRANKLGTLFLPDTDPMSQKEHEIVDKFGVDVFGQVPTKKQFECVCPHCNRNLAASRFAPHLEKCMGMGRNSSRIASRRQARIAKELERLPGDEKNDSDDHQSPDDDNDVDWSYNADKRLKKLKKEKQMSSSPRRNKFHKLRNGDASSERSNTPEPHIAPYELMSTEERKQLLIQTCGVISEHTKRMCTRSHRCPQHTDEQRKQVRSFLLGHGGLEDDLIDIDTLDDSEHQSLRESLAWDANSTESSPVDTALGNTTSRKRHFGKSNSFSSKSKKKKSGKHAGSHSQSQHSNSSSSSSTMYEFD